MSTIESIHKNLSELAVSVSVLNNDANVAHQGTAPSIKKSYSDVVASRISTIVKSAVEQSMQKQRAVERENASVAIRNMVKYGSDADDVRSLLDYLGCHARIINLVRIGHHSNSPTNSRLLKIQLSSVAEKTNLLRCAKYLKTTLQHQP